MGRFVFQFFILMVFAAGQSAGTGHASEPGIGSVHPPELRQLVGEGLASNQGLKAMAHQVNALGRKAVAAGALDDPRMSLGVANLPSDSWDVGQEAMTQKQISVSQRFPWTGKLSLRVQSATIDTLRQRAELAAKQLFIYRNIADNYYELGFITESQVINRRMTGLMDQILRVAESRYATGKGLQQDILRAQVEQGRLMDQAIALKTKRRRIQDRILQTLNRKGFSEIVPPSLSHMPNIDIDTEGWEAAALAHNPGIYARKLVIDQAGIDIELARKAYWPDPDLRLAYGQRDDDPMGRKRSDFLSASVAFSIPLWARDKQDQRLAGAESRLEAAQAKLRELTDTLPHRVDALATEIGDTRESYRLFDDAVLVQARQWAASALSAYGVGRVDFTAAMEAHLRLLRLERQRARYLYSFHKTVAALEELMGTAPWGPTPSSLDGPPQLNP
ncbi:MAG: TolC family protein [Desulfobacterales bacterium]|nr:TolC family protein [Desulfobacterales bacterium]